MGKILRDPDDIGAYYLMKRIIQKAGALVLLLSLGTGAGCIGSGPVPPDLDLPSDADTVSGDELEFSWDAVTEATHYHLEVSREDFFSTLAVDADSVTGTTYLLDLATFTSPLEGKETYYWRVSAYKDGWGGWSEIRSFYNANPKRP